MITEAEISTRMFAWLGERYPDMVREYHRADDRRAAARSLLRYWMGCDGSVVYELPAVVLDKLGVVHDRMFDDREIALAGALGAQLERRVRP